MAAHATGDVFGAAVRCLKRRQALARLAVVRKLVENGSDIGNTAWNVIQFPCHGLPHHQPYLATGHEACFGQLQIKFGARYGQG